jgi:aminoglycoside phosphotransferase (APT) family kinase protein
VPALAPRLPLPVPVLQRLGQPSGRFPRSWIITTWVPGDPADRVPATRGAEAADALAAFLTALHRPAPATAPHDTDRGGALADRAEDFARGFTAVVGLGLIPDRDAVRAIWDDAVTAPRMGRPAAVAPRGPPPSQRAHCGRHHLRRDRLRRHMRRGPGL